MSFQDELAGIKRMSVEKRGAEVIAAYEKGIDELRADGIAGRALAVGDSMPGFALPNADGATVRSADLLGRGPLVVTFYRGGWCPYCNLELRAYQAQAARLAAAGATVVAISPEVPDETAKTVASNALAFDVLSDAGNAVARSFGLVFRLSDELVEIYRRNGNDLERRNGDGSWELPVPGTFVVDADGRVALADVDPDYTRRLDPEQVIAAVERLAR
ncbi:MAG: peroxiredoxin-like family protein [Thalassobaculum sp.]|uniref:peroxiredoxin-like family protein n=1 Tax=Thalassobaculum sp. TaxID=2022740 RepID=UPI0032EE09B1